MMAPDNQQNIPSEQENLAPEAREALIRFNAAKRECASLLPTEFFWRDHGAWLESQGYKLRPRYQPGWEPDIPMFETVSYNNENFVSMARQSVVDAIRVKDGKRVLLKKISASDHPHEVEITKFFGTEPLANDPRNYCVHLLDVINLPERPVHPRFSIPTADQRPAI
ncbi:hypothetical protein BDN72DRAFT_81782 [Pluteus cervinus]|uniref:Uncharacterized protein n=1 Tax=Pluteus cervinus TaxID=181527 RepID=A0ACD3B9K9_9AGAR|nr:hypothetical protein BDN72DRAFT_81782 [Pluteus cervinus]